MQFQMCLWSLNQGTKVRLATATAIAIAIPVASSACSSMAELYFNEDTSRLLAVPPECHRHMENLEAESLNFVKSKLCWASEE